MQHPNRQRICWWIWLQSCPWHREMVCLRPPKTLMTAAIVPPPKVPHSIYLDFGTACDWLSTPVPLAKCIFVANLVGARWKIQERDSIWIGLGSANLATRIERRPQSQQRLPSIVDWASKHVVEQYLPSVVRCQSACPPPLPHNLCQPLPVGILL